MCACRPMSRPDMASGSLRGAEESHTRCLPLWPHAPSLRMCRPRRRQASRKRRQRARRRELVPSAGGRRRWRAGCGRMQSGAVLRLCMHLTCSLCPRRPGSRQAQRGRQPARRQPRGRRDAAAAQGRGHAAGGRRGGRAAGGCRWRAASRAHRVGAGVRAGLGVGGRRSRARRTQCAHWGRCRR